MFAQMSGKCQGILKFPANDEKQKMASSVFLTFWIQAKSFW